VLAQDEFEALNVGKEVFTGMAKGSLSPKKKLAFFLLSLIAIWSISEITSFTLYFVLTGKIFPLTEFHLAIRRAGREKAIAREQAQWNRQASYTVHPYLLALGAQIDVVVNIDGFNEVALPPAENLLKKVFPVYPGVGTSL
jgi:hypothetical protein